MSVALQNNGGNTTTISSNSSFTLSNTIPPNTSYSVTVSTQPTAQHCNVSNGTGTTGNGTGGTAINNIVVTCSNAITPTALSSSYNTTVWQDNFATDNISAPNPNLWSSIRGNGAEYGNVGWGNNEAEYYLPANATISNGTLNLVGKADASVANYHCADNQSSCQFSSAKLTSVNTVDLSKPGFLEIKASVPVSMGSWPALWLLPGPPPSGNFPPSNLELANQTHWPAGGEIDMLEYMWAYTNGNPSQTQISMHLPQPLLPSGYSDHYEYTRSYVSGGANTMHLYQLLWTTTQISYAVDNSIVMTCTKATQSCSNLDPSSPASFPSGSIWPYGASYSNYYLIMNLAIGGAGITGGNTALIPSNYNQTMQVSYVRYMTP
jgi:beta-glucanase (GH16 family)